MNTTLPKFKEMREFPVMSEEEGIPLFFPAVSTAAASAVSSVLAGRWIGQGPCVEEFERCFGNFIEAPGQCISVNSGTSALHMAYVLAGVRPGKKVICPLFTCTATNLAILYAGGIPVFCDVSQDSLNMDIALIERLIDSDTVAISVVDYGGLPCNYRELRSICDKYNLKLISDLAHCIDGKFDGKRVHSYTDFACFSFQAIKTLTTGDGGCLFVSDPKDFESAIKMRWFGIDRKAKQSGTWSNDISHLGFKYHMNDIAASIGLSNLTFIPDLLRKRREIFNEYLSTLTRGNYYIFEAPEKQPVDFTPWIITIDTDGKRQEIMEALRRGGVESAQVHYRNDRYSIFREFSHSQKFPRMDAIEENYLVLPLHHRMEVEDVRKIADIITGLTKQN